MGFIYIFDNLERLLIFLGFIKLDFFFKLNLVNNLDMQNNIL